MSEKHLKNLKNEIEHLEEAMERGDTCGNCKHTVRAESYYCKVCIFYGTPILVNGDYSSCKNFEKDNDNN